MKHPINSKNRGALTWRIAPIMVVFLSVIVLVIGQILFLVLVHGEEFQIRSELNRIRSEILPARRGSIRDRHGRYLATNEPVYQLVRTGSDTPAQDVFTRLSERLNFAPKKLENQVENTKPNQVVTELTEAEHVWVRENKERLNGLSVTAKLRRVYHYPRVGASVLGYTGEINPEELKRRRQEGLSQGTFVGKHGVERTYDSRLQGQNGVRWIETTARGEYVRTLETPQPVQPEPGDSLPLTIDIKLQKQIAHQFGSDSEGGAIVMNLKSGEILALYSHPTYNPNKLVARDEAYIDKLMKDEFSPLYNRMVQSRFPPASTFKIFPYLTALETKNFPASNEYRCWGTWRLGIQEFECWKEYGHGYLTLDQALVNSCNIYFYKLIQQIGYEKVLNRAKSLGFRALTKIDFPGETRSQLSSPEVKNHYSPEPWVTGDEINFVIGQGYSLVTPVKQAQLLGGLLTNQYVRPHLKKGLKFEPVQLDISAQHRARLRRTLDQATDDGTGYWAQHDESYRLRDLKVLGKTGTVEVAEVRGDPNLPEESDQETERKPDAWFISAAPSQAPRYAVVVFLMDAGTGSTRAAPMAREIYKSMEELDYLSDSRVERIIEQSHAS